MECFFYYCFIHFGFFLSTSSNSKHYAYTRIHSQTHSSSICNALPVCVCVRIYLLISLRYALRSTSHLNSSVKYDKVKCTNKNGLKSKHRTATQWQQYCYKTATAAIVQEEVEEKEEEIEFVARNVCHSNGFMKRIQCKKKGR